MGFIINVGRLMGILPRPRVRCSLHDDRIEHIKELPIVHVSAIDGDYHDNNIS
jgi:hypothetical protein